MWEYPVKVIGTERNSFKSLDEGWLPKTALRRKRLKRRKQNEEKSTEQIN